MAANNITHGSGDLREQRLAAGLSQLELAQVAGCSPSMLGLIDRGYRPSGGNVLARIEAALRGIEAHEKRPAGEPGASTTLAVGAAAGARAA